MQLSVWARINDIGRLALIAVVSSFFAMLLLWITEGGAAPFFDLPIALLCALMAIIGAVSIGFAGSIETLQKDISANKKIYPKDKYDRAIDALANLRREILANLLLVIVVLPVDFLLRVAASVYNPFCEPLGQACEWLPLSIRAAGVTILGVVAYQQIKAFFLATDYRVLLAKNG